MIKSLLFYFLLILWTIFAGIIFTPFLFLPKNRLYRAAYIWIEGIFLLLNKICGISYKIIGQQYINDEQARLVASKHQSTFETLLFFYKVPKSMFIHKRELFFIPIFGLYLKKINMVAIDRSGGPKALKKMLNDSKNKIKRGYSLIIFPEGTRKMPGSDPDYKPGVAGIYKELNTNVIPVALNSGLFWSKHSFVIKPGEIIIEFLPPIKHGLSKKEFLDILEKKIEDKTSILLS